MENEIIPTSPTIKVVDYPIHIEVETPSVDARPIHLSGNFNDWQLGSVGLVREVLQDNKVRFTIPPGTPVQIPLEYKFMKGDWQGEELDEYGLSIANRIWHLGSTDCSHVVPRWKLHGKSYQERFLPIIEVLDGDFDIPKLIKTRRIAALLPYDYYQTDKHYPVLYLQDGQNLFDDHAPFGSWGVDKRLAALAERYTHEVIVVSIDHAEKDRISEFTPSYRTTIGAGDGKKYVRFLADHLKPYVDHRYRTFTEREHTGIGGSSMGGLISIYAGLMYPEVYGKLMIFSPSLWVAPNIQFNAIQFEQPEPSRIYLYAGEKESANMVPNIQRFKAALEQKGHQRQMMKFKLAIDPHGQHNEARWGREFPKALEWLFYPDQ